MNVIPTNHYRWWPIFDTMPEGWSIDNRADAPLSGHVFITNGKSIFSGQQEKALLRVRTNEASK